VAVAGFDHVQLSLPAGGEAVADAFYRDLLGFDTEEKPAVLAARGGRWYRSGDTRLHVGVDHDFRPATRAHPALVIDDLDALVATLATAGVNVEWDQNIPGVRRGYVHDPFGNRLELVADH